MPATTVSVTPPKGGQGATTVAATIALIAAATDATTRVLLVSDDAAVVLGIPEASDYSRVVTSHPEQMNLAVAVATPDGWHGDLRVVDGPTADADVTILVTLNCYLALRNAVRAEVRPDRVVLIREPGRALDTDDVAELLRAPVTAIDADPAVARRIDAGILARPDLPRSLSPLRQLVRDDLGLGGIGSQDLSVVRAALARVDTPPAAPSEGLGL